MNIAAATAPTGYVGGRASNPVLFLSPSTNGSSRTNATLQRQQQHGGSGASATVRSNLGGQWGRLWMMNRRLRQPSHSLLHPQQQHQQQLRSSATYYYYPTTLYNPQTTTIGSSSASAGAIKLRPSCIFSLVSVLVFGIVILEGHYYSLSSSSSSSRRFKNHSRHISPVVVVAVSSGGSSSTTIATTTTTISSGTAASIPSSSSTHHSLPSPPPPSTETSSTSRSNESMLLHPKSSTATTTATSPAATQRRHMNERPEWLESYLAFHQQHVLPLEQHQRRRHEIDPAPRYRLVHHTNDTVPPRQSDDDYTPSLTYRCNGQSCGGIGDRLQGLVQTFFMAICSNRLFTIDWHESSHRAPLVEQPQDSMALPPRTTTTTLSSYLQPRDVQWDAMDQAFDNQPPRIPTMTTEEEEKAQVNADEPILILHAMDNRNLTLLVEPDVILPVQNVMLQTNLWMGDTFLNGQCWQSYRRRFPSLTLSTTPESAATLYRWAFEALFTWSPAVRNAAATLRQRAHLSPSRHFVGLHIRTGLMEGTGRSSGGDRSMPKRHADPTEWSRFLQCAYKVRTKLRERWCPEQGDSNDRVVHQPSMDLYLASDHRSVKEALLVEDPSIKTVLDLSIHHVDIKTQSDVTSDNSDVDGSLAAWSELYILHQAVCLVQSHSKYSAVAGAISESQCAIHYDDCSDEIVSLAVSSVANERESEGSSFMMCG